MPMTCMHECHCDCCQVLGPVVDCPSFVPCDSFLEEGECYVGPRVVAIKQPREWVHVPGMGVMPLDEANSLVKAYGPDFYRRCVRFGWVRR